MKPTVYELKKKAERERLRMYRKRQKLGLINTKQTSTSAEVSLQEEGRESSSFSNKQSKYRSLLKAEKALLSSPNKRTEVVGALATKYKLRINLIPQKPGPKAQVLKDKKIDWLTVFRPWWHQLHYPWLRRSCLHWNFWWRETVCSKKISTMEPALSIWYFKWAQHVGK